MRVKFKEYDTHEDLNNIIEPDCITFKKDAKNNDIVKIFFKNKKFFIDYTLITNIDNLLIEDEENNIIILDSLACFCNIEIEIKNNSSDILYFYIFKIIN